MNWKKMKKVFYTMMIVIFAVDRILKYISLKNFSDAVSERFFIIPKFLSFTFFKNDRLAFSLPLHVDMIVIVSIIIIGFLLWYFITHTRADSAPWIFLITLGAISNFYDRLAYKYVVDYLHLAPVSYFNVADVMIGGGIILLIFNTQFSISKK